MKKSKHFEMYEQIERHGRMLINFFGIDENTDPVDLCKKLRRIEHKVHYAMECLCNTNNLTVHEYRYNPPAESTEEEQDKFFDQQMKRLLKIIGEQNAEKVFFNHDPRGYSLKIRPEHAKDTPLYKDLGGYGIIAPDFSEN